MMSSATYPLAVGVKLPWHINAQQEKRFHNILKKVLIPVLLFLFSVPWLPLFEKTIEEPEKKTVRTKVLLTQPIATLKKSMVAKRSLVKATGKSITKKQKVTKKPKQGLAAFAKQLSALRGAVDVSAFKNKNTLVTTTGSKALNSRTVLGKNNATRRSSGIKVDASKLQEHAVLAAHQTSSVESPIQIVGLPDSDQRGYSSGIEGQRDMESIRRVFEKYKGSVFALYTQSLRAHPNLRGQFMFRLVIEPNGTISDLKLVTSDLGARSLERNILSKIKNIRFSEEDVVATAVQYKFMFLPS